jgi:hypothetical protein
MQEPVVWISADSHALVDYSKSPELADFMSPLIGDSVAHCLDYRRNHRSRRYAIHSEFSLNSLGDF